MIEEGGEEPVAPGERYISVVEHEVAHAAGVAAGFRRESGWIETLRIGEIPRKCIGCEELQPLRKTLVQRNGQSIVVLNSAADFRLHFTKQRIFQQRSSVGEAE